MSLPKSFSDAAAYFDAILVYFEKFSWIFENANTRFLRCGVMERMPASFQDYFQNVSWENLNRFPDLLEQISDLPEELEDLRKDTLRLTPKNQNFTLKISDHADVSLEQKKPVRNLYMNPKKQHEVQRLSKRIVEVLLKTQATEEAKGAVLVDLGAGLGHLHHRILDHLSATELNCWILALEMNKDYIQKALGNLQVFKERNRSTHKRHHRILYEEHRIADDTSKEFIENRLEYLQEQEVRSSEDGSNLLCLPNSWTLMGLHACGDLAVTAMKLFLSMDNVQHLIIAPCCYHKLQQNPLFTQPHSEYSEFRNFPLSESLRTSIGKRTKFQDNFQKYFNRPFLRLACQETAKRWYQQSEREHKVHGKRMFQRAMADILVNDDEIEFVKVLKTNRKDEEDSPEYLDSFEQFSQHYQICAKDTGEVHPWSEGHHRKYNQIFEKYRISGVKLAEGLTCLQTTMQKLCENVILYDRLCFMREVAERRNLRIRAHYERLFDESLSPRCQVLIAEKLQ